MSRAELFEASVAKGLPKQHSLCRLLVRHLLFVVKEAFKDLGVKLMHGPRQEPSEDVELQGPEPESCELNICKEANSLSNTHRPCP